MMDAFDCPKQAAQIWCLRVAIQIDKKWPKPFFSRKKANVATETDRERERETMEEEEHEVYGGEIPDVGEMDGDMEVTNPDMDMTATDDDAVKVCFSSLILYRSSWCNREFDWYSIDYVIAL